VKLDTREAGDLLRQAVEVDPTNAIVLTMQADYLEHGTKDIEATHNLYARACQLAPDSPDVLGAFAAFLSHTLATCSRRKTTRRKTTTPGSCACGKEEGRGEGKGEGREGKRGRERRREKGSRKQGGFVACSRSILRDSEAKARTTHRVWRMSGSDALQDLR